MKSESPKNGTEVKMKKMERQYLSRKKYTCSLCGKERRGNADTKSEAIICWCCTLKLISVKNEDLIRLWDKRRNAQPLIKNFMRIFYETANRSRSVTRSRSI